MDIKLVSALLTKMTNEHISKYIEHVPVKKQEQYVVEMQELLRESLHSVKTSIVLEKKRKVELTERINKLNNLCDGTLSMTSYIDGTLWVVESYGDDTLLSPTCGSANAMSFEEAIDKALKIAEERIK